MVQWYSGTVKATCLEPIETTGLTEADAAKLAHRCQVLIEEECIRISH